MESLTAIANVAGVPAALLVGYLFLRVRQLGTEVESLKKARDDDRKETDSKLNAIFDRLNNLAVDVSFVRGKLEE